MEQQIKNNKLRSLPEILIIDDREYDRFLYKEYLLESNYNFFELDDGEKILEFLGNNIPDLIILDWEMPKKDGLSVLKSIKNNRRYKSIPIVVITGHESVKVLEQAFDYGCSDFLVKPVNEKELIVRVNNLLMENESKQILQKENTALHDLNEIIKHQNSQLKNSVENDLQSMNISIEKFRKLFDKIEVDLKQIINLKEDSVENILQSVSKLMKEIELNKPTLEDNELIKVNSSFNRKLLAINPLLTNLDLEHCQLLRSNLSNADIAKILFIETKSLQTKRYRLKKKLNLNGEDSLRQFLISI